MAENNHLKILLNKKSSSIEFGRDCFGR